MAVFGFFKPYDPAFNGLEDGGIVELESKERSSLVFQMVPSDGRRGVIANGPDGVDCRITVKSPQVVELSNRVFKRLESSGPVSAPISEDRFSQPVPAGMKLDFDLKGIAAGSTEVVIETARGGNAGVLKVSVKNERRVVVSACRLVDLEFKNPFDDQKIRESMARATKVYKNCANISLLNDGVVYPVECDVGLGNPIVLGRQLTEFNGESSTVAKHIKRKVPAAAKRADIVAIFGWDFEIVHSPIVGLNDGRFCFVEFDMVALNRNLTLQHEIGHALSLGHHKVLTIMNGDGFNGLERFEDFEIEKLNPLQAVP